MDRMNSLEAWLSHHDARMLWSASSNDKAFRPVKVTCYQIGTGICLVQRYAKGDGWELFIPAANTLSVADTLRGAERALSLTTEVQS